eukprot:1289076-Amorphochlora_amoeboformis.AAC.1
MRKTPKRKINGEEIKDWLTIETTSSEVFAVRIVNMIEQEGDGFMKQNLVASSTKKKPKWDMAAKISSMIDQQREEASKMAGNDDVEIIENIADEERDSNVSMTRDGNMGRSQSVSSSTTLSTKRTFMDFGR